MTTSSDQPQETAAKRRTRDRSSIKIKIAGAWTASPNRLLKDTRLSRDARLLGALMFLHAANRGTAFPSQQELAEELSHTAEVIEQDPATGAKTARYEYRQVSVRSVQRWLTELKRCGWLEWRQTLKNNAYTLLDPSERDDNPDSSDNDALTGATAVSPGATEGSRSDTTEGSDQATAASCHLIPLSSSTFIHEDSWDEDSSSSEIPPTLMMVMMLSPTCERLESMPPRSFAISISPGCRSGSPYFSAIRTAGPAESLRAFATHRQSQHQRWAAVHSWHTSTPSTATYFGPAATRGGWLTQRTTRFTCCPVLRPQPAKSRLRMRQIPRSR